MSITNNGCWYVNLLYESACSIDDMLDSMLNSCWTCSYVISPWIKYVLVSNDLHDKSGSKWPWDGFWSWKNML